ncbi:MAG: hypothetical protein WD468_11185 [Pirellulales bacterium]
MAEQASQVQARRKAASPTPASGGRPIARSRKKAADRPPMGHYVGIAVTALLIVGTLAAFVVWGVPVVDRMLAFGDGASLGNGAAKKDASSADDTRPGRPLPPPAGRAVEDEAPVEAVATAEPATDGTADPMPGDATGTDEVQPEQSIPDPEVNSKFPKFVDLPAMDQKEPVAVAELEVPDEGIKVDEFNVLSDLCQLQKDHYFFAKRVEAPKGDAPKDDPAKVQAEQDDVAKDAEAKGDPVKEDADKADAAKGDVTKGDGASDEQRWTFHPALKDKPPAEQPAIAMMLLKGRELNFQWLEAAAKAPAAEQLRNTMVRISAGGTVRTMGLRAPVTAEPITMDMSKRYMTQKLTLPSPPNMSDLWLEVTLLDHFPTVPKFKFNRKQVSLNKNPPDEVIIQLAKINEGDTPEVHLQGVVVEGGAIELKISPMIVNSKGRHELSKAAVDKIRSDKDAEFATIEKDWMHFRDEGIMLDREIREINQKAGRRNSRTERATDQKKLRDKSARLGVVNRKFKQLDAKKKQLEPLIKAVPAVEGVVNSLHNGSRIRYRIRAKAGDMYIDLFDTKLDEG